MGNLHTYAETENTEQENGEREMRRKLDAVISVLVGAPFFLTFTSLASSIGKSPERLVIVAGLALLPSLVIGFIVWGMGKVMSYSNNTNKQQTTHTKAQVIERCRVK